MNATTPCPVASQLALAAAVLTPFVMGRYFGGYAFVVFLAPLFLALLMAHGVRRADHGRESLYGWGVLAAYALILGGTIPWAEEAARDPLTGLGIINLDIVACFVISGWGLLCSRRKKHV